jgi:hypothetical protein
MACPFFDLGGTDFSTTVRSRVAEGDSVPSRVEPHATALWYWLLGWS